MKKIMFLLAFLPMFVFTACSDDEKDEPQLGSYQVVNQSYFEGGKVAELDGTMYNCVVVEIDKDNNPVKQDYVGTIKSKTGKSDVIETDSKCSSILVTFYMLPDDSKYEPINKRLMIGKTFQIDLGKTTIVTLTNETPTTTVKI